MSSAEWYILAVSTFITCRLWLTVNGMLDGLLDYLLNGPADEEE